MIPKYYKERKEKTNFEKNSSTTTFTEKKTSTWCVLLSPFPKKGRGTICLVSLLLYLQKTSLMDAIIFIFCQQSNYYFQIYYISPVAPYDKNLPKLLLADFFSFFSNLFLFLLFGSCHFRNFNFLYFGHFSFVILFNS